jgi:tRNA (guanine37-N1)-methyltransferase
VARSFDIRIDVLTLFPAMFEPYLGASILGRAREAGWLEVAVHDIRDWAEGRHKQADDAPFGGGQGMVLKPEPVVGAIEAVRDRPETGRGRVVMMTPQGAPFRQEKARRLAALPHLVLVCGRYEGVDERVREGWVDEELSLGDFVLTGGELPALAVIDAVARLTPGVLGNEASHADESFEAGLLEYPQYTRPREFRGRTVPEVLLSGDHGRIARWRAEQALERTRQRRPDLIGRDGGENED